jgi:hypothetical protein
MDGGSEWLGARIAWHVDSASLGESDLEFEGKIETAESIGDGIVRISGALMNGGRFVLVAHDEGFLLTD